MAVSPDGSRVVVSASTGNVVHVLRMRDGKEVGKFRSGGSPHESVYIDGGKRILHASIGMVYSPLDEPGLPDPPKQERVLQIVDAKTFKILRRYNVRKALDARGMKDASIAVRPMTLSPDEKKFYFQLSFFHGFVEMDRRTGQDHPRRAAAQPGPEHCRASIPARLRAPRHRDEPDGHQDLRRRDDVGLRHASSTPQPGRTAGCSRAGKKPYWVTPSWDGRYCYISWSGSDKVSKISYRTGRIVADPEVGDHPQRVRNGFIRTSYLQVSATPRRPSRRAPRAPPPGSAELPDVAEHREQRLVGRPVGRDDQAVRAVADGCAVRGR